MRPLMVVSLVLLAAGCSLSNDPPSFSRLSIQVPAPGPKLQTPFESMLSTVTPPSTSDGFTCLALNVVGPGIAPSFGNAADASHFPELLAGTSYCTYPGITALLPNLAAGASSINVNLKVPSGPKRLIQMLGFVDSGNEICSNGVLDARADQSQNAKPFEIARTIIDLFRDSHAVLEENWNSLSAAQQAARDIDCKSQLELYANAVRGHSSLVAYWPYVESGGTIAYNQKAIIGDMTLAGGASLGVAAGPVTGSTALRVPGVSYAAVAGGYTFSSSVFSVEMWVKLTTCTPNSALFQMRSSGSELIEVYCDVSGYLQFFVQDSVGYNNSISGPYIRDGQWHYIVAGKDGSNYLKLYHNGNHYADSSGNTWMSNAFPFTTSPKTLVGLDEINGGVQPGDIAHVAVYDQALTQANVTTHYNAAGYSAPPPLRGPPAFTSR